MEEHSEFKEKREKKSFLKDSMQKVKKALGKGKTSKTKTEDPQQPPKEQKQQLLSHKYASDEDPITHSFLGRIPGIQQIDVMEGGNKMITLSNGRKVDEPTMFMPPRAPEYVSSPVSGRQSPSSYPPSHFPMQADRRQGYNAPVNQQWGNYEVQDPRVSTESLQQKAVYDNLLREAQTLRRDLEKEYSLNRGSKEEMMDKINLKKMEIADVQRNKPSNEVFDDIISSLSMELLELEKKVKDIENRMTPLDRAIVDLKDAETFIRDRELDSEGAIMLFQEIMKKMFDDINVGGHVLSGEAAGQLPKNVLDEMKGKMLTGALKKSDPGNVDSEDIEDWVDFDDNATREKITSTGGEDASLMRKKRKDKFQRVSRKMTNITDFTHTRSKHAAVRTDAFKFHAFGREEAFKRPDYYPKNYAEEAWDVNIPILEAPSIASDQKSTAEELEKIEKDQWLGFDMMAMTPPPSDKAESMQSSKSVIDLTTLEQFPGSLQESSSKEHVPAEVSSRPKPPKEAESETPSPDRTKKEKFQKAEESEEEVPEVIQPVSSKPLRPAQVQTSTELEEEETPKPKPKKETQKTAKAEEEEESEEKEGGLSEQLNKVKLKTAAERPPGPSTAPIPSDDDFMSLAALIISETSGSKKPAEGVKLDLQTQEKVEPPKKPAAKPPPPPPKKSPPPPPPPPPKKGGPPPPPGKKADEKKGGAPPPPKGGKKAQDGLQRAPEVIAMFQEMRKALLGDAAKGSGGPKKIGGDGASADPGALMEELAKNSKYAAQVQADIVNYGSIIENLIKEISKYEAGNMKDLIEFVEKVDSLLGELSDETAVLKQFEWPARYYTMLEAKGLYLELEKMKNTFKTWKWTAKKPADELKNIQKFMDKSKNRVEVLLRTKDADEKKFKDAGIPWNGKIYTEVKVASLSVLILYMDIVLGEVDTIMGEAPAETSPQRQKAIEKSMAQLTGAINFAFKTHQFAGGFTEACNTKFSNVASRTRDLKNEAANMAS